MKIKLLLYACIAVVFVSMGWGIQKLYDDKIILEKEYQTLSDEFSTLKSVAAENETQLKKQKEDMDAVNVQIAAYQSDLNEKDAALQALKKKKTAAEKQADRQIADYEAANPGLTEEEKNSFSIKLKSSVRIDSLWDNYCANNAFDILMCGGK